MLIIEMSDTLLPLIDIHLGAKMAITLGFLRVLLMRIFINYLHSKCISIEGETNELSN